MKMKHKIMEMLSSISIIIIFVLSFSFTFDTLSGKTLMQIAVRECLLLEQYTSARAYVVLYFSLIFGVLSFVVLLYPMKHEIYLSLEKGLNPILRRVGFVIVEGNIRRKN